MNICYCGSEQGYQHTPDCPYPYYGHDDSEARKWKQARDAKPAADLAALRAENARLREALQYLLEDYRVRLFAIGHTYEDIDNSVVVQEARAALA